MPMSARLLIGGIIAVVITASTANAQQLEVKRYNPSPWTKGKFTEVVTVTGPGKIIYLAGIGAEDEKAPEGSNAQTLHVGDPYTQCKYAYDKIGRLLAAHGATLADVVMQVVYVTDVRFQGPVRKCRDESYGKGPIPANTFLVIGGLASPTMLLEIDITAAVAK
jgi:2-iminobutanoate/2-iminopropanoate deaminase